MKATVAIIPGHFDVIQAVLLFLIVVFRKETNTWLKDKVNFIPTRRKDALGMITGYYLVPFKE